MFCLWPQNVEVEKKRKGVDDNNPTLYWEYKWAEDGNAEVIYEKFYS